ncbi:MAG: histidinol dehydrogenase [Elusimicrobiota bacterium]
MEISFMEKIERKVKKIIQDIRRNGDRALCQYTRQYDQVSLSVKELKVSVREIDHSEKSVSGDIKKALRFAAINIEKYYRQQLKTNNLFSGLKQLIVRPGMMIEDLVQPIEKIGIYVPGGRFSYPSTVLMIGIPAKVSGVGRVLMVTAPGGLTAEVLFAAKISGIKEIYRIGGAQAIAALAYGTETVPKVDKIFGPGNIYVTMAKKIVFGDVGIDMLAGPSEVMIVADRSCPANFIVQDLLAQLEHDPRTRALLVSWDSGLLAEVEKSFSVPFKPSLKFVRVKSPAQVGRLVNDYAPEHLQIMCKNPRSLLPKIKNAGAIFLGRYTPAALGDYLAGPSHVLPTGGTARFSSGLRIEDFVKKTNVISYNENSLRRVAPYVISLAEKEGLVNHSRSVKARF